MRRTVTDQNSTQRFFGAALITVGVLLAVLCGTCTALFGGMSLIQIIAGHGAEGEFNANSILPFALIVGAPPTLLGAALIYVGRRLRRPTPRPSAPPPG